MNIKELREALGESQSEFAKHIGISRMTVWRWETGKSDPTNYIQRELDKLQKRIQARQANQ
jgi:DNA-binding transcriptional regulator YiaG